MSISEIRPATDLSLTIVHADGRTDRWGPDEKDGRQVPSDLTFTTSIPGGFKDLTCSLEREMSTYPDEVLFDDLFVYGAGADIVWNGYMAQFPRETFNVKPTAVGWVNSLRFDTSAREVYVDRDLSNWQTASTARASFWNNSSHPFYDSTVTSGGAGGGTVNVLLVGAWTTGPVSEAWFNAGGIPLGAFYYSWSVDAGIISIADAHWSWEVGFSTDDVATGFDISSNLRPATNPNTFTTASANRVWAFIQLGYDIAAGAANQNYVIYFHPAIYGRHGLTGRGSAPVGYYPADIITNIVSRWGTLLNYTYPGSIEQDTSFIVPNYAQYTPSTAFDMLSAVNVYELKDWGVYSDGEDNYPNRTFFLREPSAARLTWHARRSDGAILADEGIQSENLVNGVTVSYTGYDGTQYSVGPTGTGCTFADNSLVDTDPNNPVNSHNLGRKYGQLVMNKRCDLTSAVKLGNIWLTRRLGIQHRGTLTLKGWVRHPTAGLTAVSRVRAGDYVIVEDDPRDQVPRRIVNTSYSHNDRSIQCDLEHDAFRIDALMEQIGAVLYGIV